MADVELLPLPEWASCDEIVRDMSTSEFREAMRDYARANMEALRAERDAQQAENKRLRKDAERYRWLRDANINTLPYDNHGMGPEFPYDDDLDATIDAALAQEQGEKNGNV